MAGESRGTNGCGISCFFLFCGIFYLGQPNKPRLNLGKVQNHPVAGRHPKRTELSPFDCRLGSKLTGDSHGVSSIEMFCTQRGEVVRRGKLFRDVGVPSDFARSTGGTGLRKTTGLTILTPGFTCLDFRKPTVRPQFPEQDQPSECRFPPRKILLLSYLLTDCF